MANEFSNVITLMEIGKSFEGRPLYVLKVGEYLYFYILLDRIFFVIIKAFPKNVKEVGKFRESDKPLKHELGVTTNGGKFE